MHGKYRRMAETALGGSSATPPARIALTRGAPALLASRRAVIACGNAAPEAPAISCHRQNTVPYGLRRANQYSGMQVSPTWRREGRLPPSSVAFRHSQAGFRGRHSAESRNALPKQRVDRRAEYSEVDDFLPSSEQMCRAGRKLSVVVSRHAWTTTTSQLLSRGPRPVIIGPRAVVIGPDECGSWVCHGYSWIRILGDWSLSQDTNP